MKATGTVLAVVASLTVVAWGQSLEELAQKEKARRKATQSAQTFTNDDLAKPSPSPSPTDEPQGAPGKATRRFYQPAQPAAPTQAGGSGEGGGVERHIRRGNGTEPEPGDLGPEAQAYWRDRSKAAQSAIHAAQKDVAQAQVKIDRSRKSVGQPLPIDGTQQLPVNPMLKTPELVEAEAELTAANASLAEAQQAVDDLREEARRKGVPAGWVR